MTVSGALRLETVVTQKRMSLSLLSQVYCKGKIRSSSLSICPPLSIRDAAPHYELYGMGSGESTRYGPIYILVTF